MINVKIIKAVYFYGREIGRCSVWEVFEKVHGMFVKMALGTDNNTHINMWETEAGKSSFKWIAY